MILQSQVLEESIVPYNICLDFLNLGLVFEVQITFYEAFVQFDNLA